MEIFVFPELMFSLVLANIMSPVIWSWLDDPWFDGISKLKPYRRVQRLKQYVMDHYVFNLDLDTWGLTRQERELKRFSGFLSPEVIAQSNALFGYQGDTYYFDIDIRTHFGLDKYDSDVIPYWKTETVEAMDAFRYRDGFAAGAGECVSLAALYASALFVVCGLPLEDIYLMATPLHSQNFLDWETGILINNRRLVTKAMWFNGTQISGQARRALENEKVTIVSHVTGWIHTLYEQAWIAPEAYGRFSRKLSDYLKVPLTPEILGNFLRHQTSYQPYFVLGCRIGDKELFLPLEKAFLFEGESPYFVTDHTREKLIASIPRETFSLSRPSCRILLNDIETYIKTRHPSLESLSSDRELAEMMSVCGLSGTEIIENLKLFCWTVPRLPDSSAKRFGTFDQPLDIRPGMSREEIIREIEGKRAGNIMADMAFYAWRDMGRTDPRPFLKAALERNPVCLEASSDQSPGELVGLFASWPGESIYGEPFRLAQPDEVWNFKRGDGWERALLLGTILLNRDPGRRLRLSRQDGEALLTDTGSGGRICSYPTSKSFPGMDWTLTL